MIVTLFTVLAICATILLLFYLFQRRLIYFPEKTWVTPQQAGLPEMQVVTLKTDDNLSLQAWYKEASRPDVAHIIYLHGNAGHIGYRAMQIAPYLLAGFGLLLVTYRGYSANPGHPTEDGLYSDARAAIEFLKAKQVPVGSIVLYGESIGSAVAIQMAQEYPVGALILQAPFTSLADVGAFHYPFLPVGLLLKDRFCSLKKAATLDLPVCILHGENDNIIPFFMSQKLFYAFKGPKILHNIPFTGHNDLFEPSLVIQFLKK